MAERGRPFPTIGSEQPAPPGGAQAGINRSQTQQGSVLGLIDLGASARFGPRLPGPPGLPGRFGKEVRGRHAVSFRKIVGILTGQEGVLGPGHHEASHGYRMQVSSKATDPAQSAWPEHDRTVKGDPARSVR